MTSIKHLLKERGSTAVLKGTIYLLGLGVLALCLFVLPAGIGSDRTGYYRPILIGMYVPAIPFFIALYQSLKILRDIERKRAFSESSVRALRTIKHCGLAISLLYALGMPYIFHAADLDDAPGVAALGFVIIFASFVIAVAAGVFQKLLQHAVDIKSENDFTV